MSEGQTFLIGREFQVYQRGAALSVPSHGVALFSQTSTRILSRPVEQGADLQSQVKPSFCDRDVTYQAAETKAGAKVEKSLFSSLSHLHLHLLPALVFLLIIFTSQSLAELHHKLFPFLLKSFTPSSSTHIMAMLAKSHLATTTSII